MSDRRAAQQRRMAARSRQEPEEEEHKQQQPVDDDDDAAMMEEVETPGARLARESSERGHPTLESVGGARAATHLTQTGAQLLLLDVPSGVPLGLDRASFVAGDKFKGIKMVPPGVHYIWYSSSATGGDMAPRVGFFAYLHSGDVLVRRWDTQVEGLVELADPDEVARYQAGARRFDFDRGQGTYPLHQKDTWRVLSEFITPAVVERLEPVGKSISSFATTAAAKYNIRDKFATPEQAAEAVVKAAIKAELEEAEKTGATETSMGDVAGAESSSAAASSASAAASSSAATPASASHEADALNKFAPHPSTSFYSRIPSVSELVAAAKLKSDPAARAALTSQLHLDHTPRLEALLNSYRSGIGAPPAASSPADMSELESMLLGEMQFAFVAFLVGQDHEGFEAWKALCTLMCSCVTALETHHALYERWVRCVLAHQLVELPRDFFIDPLSGDNFLGPALQRLFDAVEDKSSDIHMPTSLTYALRELATLVAKRFHAPRPSHAHSSHQQQHQQLQRLPAFKTEDPDTVALREAAAAEARENAQPPTPLSEEARRAREEAQRRVLLQQLQAEAEDDEYAPTVAEE